MPKTIWIKCKQVCEYNQQVTVTDEEYSILMECADNGDVSETREHIPFRVIDRYINATDIYDTGHEFTEISIELETKKKKTKKAQ